MRRPFVAGNWKLHGSRSANAALIQGLRTGIGAGPPCDVVVCPPFVYLAEVGQTLAGSSIGLGAQDASDQGSGAFTGEISATMLGDVGCEYVIVGHSERRTLYGETDGVVARKLKAVIGAGLHGIVCVGETLAERDAGRTHEVVERQMTAVLDAIAVERLAGSVIAYEPVWAIGTGRTASPDQAQEVHGFIRRLVAGRSARISADIRIVYGGSVKGSNAAALFAMADIDGGLVGGASLEAEEFLKICKAAPGSAP